MASSHVYTFTSLVIVRMHQSLFSRSLLRHDDVIILLLGGESTRRNFAKFRSTPTLTSSRSRRNSSNTDSRHDSVIWTRRWEEEQREGGRKEKVKRKGRNRESKEEGEEKRKQRGRGEREKKDKGGNRQQREKVKMSNSFFLFLRKKRKTSSFF